MVGGSLLAMCVCVCVVAGGAAFARAETRRSEPPDTARCAPRIKRSSPVTRIWCRWPAG
jgi:hypothetical protein